ncbi:MAG TPA: hypothetical protein PKK12_07700 [Candidatus Aminicenantes bacterium]|nr:hypothetical protein [Candidatus Aminicenantes bacterium]
MDLKTVFAEGKKEYRRRRSLSKDNSALLAKRATLASQFALLGEKGWGQGADSCPPGELREALGAVQAQLDELRQQATGLDRQRQATEEKKKGEIDRFTRQRQEIEAKKKEIDGALNKEKGELKTVQGEIARLDSRLGQIAHEREQLQKKIADLSVPASEKAGLNSRLTALAPEETGLRESKRGQEGQSSVLGERIRPLQAESDGLGRQINDLVAQQKEVVAAVDRELAGLRKELDSCTAKAKEAGKTQQQHFERLGEVLARGDSAPAGLENELAAVHASEGEIAAVNADIAALDAQKSEASSGAYRKMLAILITGAVLVVALVVILVVVLSPRKKTPLERLGERLGQAAVSQGQVLGQAVTQLQAGLGAVSQGGESVPGQAGEVASQGLLAQVLVAVDSWVMVEPTYNRLNLTGIDTASLRTTYRQGEARAIKAEITDTHAVAVLLAPARTLLQLRMAIDDERVFQRVSEIGGMPVIESLDKTTGTARLVLVVKDRYLINLESRDDQGLDLLRGFLPRLGLGKL